jgi:8-hydroxy-5-deazaflavin:NADPH oxidoreductase
MEEHMNITTIGRGNVGGGLARRRERAGHTVTRLDREGGDAADAQVVIVAVPSDAIADALAKPSELHGKTAIDATNALRPPRVLLPLRQTGPAVAIADPTADQLLRAAWRQCGTAGRRMETR